MPTLDWIGKEAIVRRHRYVDESGDHGLRCINKDLEKKLRRAPDGP